MQLPIVDPTFQTSIFTVILAIVIFTTLKKDSHLFEMNHTHTNELKGLALLMVIFSHIGYFLDSNDKFLYPLSVAGGVGVNIFLFLSGFGLTISALKKPANILQFYLKRFEKIFLPFWIVTIIFLLMDFFILKINYPPATIWQMFLGFVPEADIYTTLNSPIWYFTLLLFYYIIFPLTFIRSVPYLSAFVIFLISYYLLTQPIPVVADTLKLYKLHYLAFPLGIVYASILVHRKHLVPLKQAYNWFKSVPWALSITRAIFVIFALILINHTAINSGVGVSIRAEQLTSLVTMICFVLLVQFKTIQSRFLILLGAYSYEIYLIQWPLMYRYDILYKNLPAWLATIAYLVMYLIIAYLLNRVSNTIYLKLNNPISNKPIS